jgi:plastocyanin
VVETEYALSLPTTSFAPGSYVFTALNKGRVAHSLQITGSGFSAASRTLDPGQSANLNVTLKEGTYDVFCPIDGHRSLGMNAQITVGGSAASAGSSSVTTAAATTSGAASRGGY